jgi:cytosine/adenosine deaminase-related metal-dependent hydrolase
MIPDTTRLWPIWFRQGDAALFASEPETLAEIAAALRFAKAHMNAGDGRIRPMIAPHATDTHTAKTMAAMAAAVRELGTGLHIHLSQSRAETERVRALWGMTPAQWLGTFGFYDFPVFGAHMTGLDWNVDPAALNAGGAVYAHCPSAGGAGAGSQPYPEALAAGLRVNIGIDTHSNDYVEDLKMSVLAGRLRARLLKGKSAAPLREPTIWDSIRGATRIPADALRRPDLGRIAPGARADLCMIDVSGALVGSGALPPEPLNNLLYANGMMVRHVMTDGRFQVFDGHLAVADEAEVIAAGGRVVATIWKQLADEGWFENEPRRG